MRQLTNTFIMLNFVSLRPLSALNFGLDFRIDRTQYREAATDLLVCAKKNINNTTAEAVSDVVTSYYYPTGPVDCEIVSDDVSDNQTITIFYWPDAAAELPSIQQITLNGTTPVTVPNQIFRGRRMVVTTPLGLNQGNVTLYETGNAANIISLLEPNLGYSRDSYLWVPANTIAVLIKGNIWTDETIPWTLSAYRYLNPAVPNFKYKVQELPISQTQHWEIAGQSPIPAGTLYEIKCHESTGTGGVEAVIGYEYVLFK